MANAIFVFGSNLAGRHGRGAALMAVRHAGAVYGVGSGRTGEAYAIPTKGAELNVLPLNTIQGFISEFLTYARTHPELKFQVTRVGCGLAGYQDPEIAPMFKDAPDNCAFDTKWHQYLPTKKFWGTF
jgi:hypothetical protein